MKRMFTLLVTLTLLLLLAVPAAWAVSASDGIFAYEEAENEAAYSIEQGESIQIQATSLRGTLATGDDVYCGLTATGLSDPAKAAANLLQRGQVDITNDRESNKQYSAQLETSGLEPGEYLFWLLHYSPSEQRYSYIWQSVTINPGPEDQDPEPEPEPEPLPEGLLARPTASTVYVDGHPIRFDAYNIEDNNYFKLRDLAYALSGSSAQFNVEWDAANNAIQLVSSRVYSIVGGEMAAPATSSKIPTPTSSGILLDGERVELAAYNIEDNNYFKLREIGQLFDFNVTWDATSNAIHIITNEPYSEDD